MAYCTIMISNCMQRLLWIMNFELIYAIFRKAYIHVYAEIRWLIYTQHTWRNVNIFYLYSKSICRRLLALESNFIFFTERKLFSLAVSDTALIHDIPTMKKSNKKNALVKIWLLFPLKHSNVFLFISYLINICISMFFASNSCNLYILLNISVYRGWNSLSSRHIRETYMRWCLDTQSVDTVDSK